MQLSHMEKLALEHTGTENVHELVEELHTAEGQYQEELTPIDKKLEGLEELRSKIQNQGMDRFTAVTLNELKKEQGENDTLALEQFTSFPSRNGINVALEEIDEKWKNIGIGLGVGLIAALIVKVIKMIFSWIRGKGEKTKESLEKGGEDQKDAADKMEDVDKVMKEIFEHDRAVKEAMDKEIKEQLKENGDGEISPAMLRINKNYTRLIDRILTDTIFLSTIRSIFNNVKELTSSADEALKIIEAFNSGLEAYGEHGELEEFLKRCRKMKEMFPPASMRENIKLIEEQYKAISEDATTPAELKPENIGLIIHVLKDGKNGKFLNLMLSNHPADNPTFSSDAFVRRNESAMQILEGTKRTKSSDGRIDAMVKGNKMTKEQAEEFKEIVKYYKDVSKSFVTLITYYNKLGSHWNRFGEIFLANMYENATFMTRVYEKAVSSLKGHTRDAKMDSLKKQLEEMKKSLDKMKSR